MCGKGFVPINKTCTDFDECLKKSPNKVKLLSDGYISCGVGATCQNKVGGYACVCQYGFRVNDGKTNIPVQGIEMTQCVDIDECDRNIFCQENAKCENSQGSYSCNCFDGFEGDNCTDIDECNGINSCDPNAECLNTDGSYKCSCKEGFYGNGDWCSPEGPTTTTKATPTTTPTTIATQISTSL